MNEIWKPIKGLEHYEVSNFGRVRRNGYAIITKNGVTKTLKTKYLKCHDNGIGYFRVFINENGRKHHESYIHRLVAQSFVENPQNKPCINHIDNDPSNNCADNLEWVTKKENSDWMVVQGRNKRTKEWLDRLHVSQKKNYKPVVATDIKTGERQYFESVNSVREKGFFPSNVSLCINGKANTHKGYTWEKAL